MIKFINGDAVEEFIKEPNSALAHGCNVFCKMRRGIAKTISDKYPIARQTDDATGTGREKIGTFSVCCVNNANSNYIFNLYTQYTYWDEDDMLEYGAVLLSLTRCLRHCKTLGVTKLYIPRIGSGLACGNKQILENLFCIAADEVPEVDLIVVDYV